MSEHLEIIPQILSNFSSNQQHVGEIVKYCENSLRAGKEIATTIGRTKKYVEDSLSSIADNILQVSQQLTEFLEIQATDLSNLTTRVNSFESKLNWLSYKCAVNYKNRHFSIREEPVHRPKLIVLLGENLPVLAKPRAKWNHNRIDLDYLSTIGYSGGNEARLDRVNSGLFKEESRTVTNTNNNNNNNNNIQINVNAADNSYDPTHSNPVSPSNTVYSSRPSNNSNSYPESSDNSAPPTLSSMRKQPSLVGSSLQVGNNNKSKQPSFSSSSLSLGLNQNPPPPGGSSVSNSTESSESESDAPPPPSLSQRPHNAPGQRKASGISSQPIIINPPKPSITQSNNAPARPSAMLSNPAPPPPMMNNNSSNPVNKPFIPQAPPSIPQAPPSIPQAPPSIPQAPPSIPQAPQAPAMDEESSVPPPPPPPMNNIPQAPTAPSAPAAPSAPMSFAPKKATGGGGGRSDLLASIQAGKKLKKAVTIDKSDPLIGAGAKQAPSSGPSSSSSGGNNNNSAGPPKALSMQEEMAARLARRKAA